MSRPVSSKRKQILELIAERLSKIQKVNGSDTDAGDHLFWGPVVLGPDDPKEAIAIVLGTTETNTAGGKKIITLPLEIHALVHADTTDSWLYAESILGDIKRVLEQTDLTLGTTPSGARLAVDFSAGEVTPLPRQEGSMMLGLVAEYRVVYTEHWGNPDK